MKLIKVNFLQFTSVVGQHLIIARVDVNVQVAKSGQFVVDLGAKEKHLKHVLELLVLGLRSPFL